MSQATQSPIKSNYNGHVDIAVGIILSIVTCGIYSLFWQYKQMAALNDLLEREEFSFVLWFLLSFITCGLFAIYYEYKMAEGILEVQERYQRRVNTNLPILCILLTLFGLGIVSIAIQ